MKATHSLFDMEIWKDIPGYEGYYQASTFGNIRSLDRNVTQMNRWGRDVTYIKKGKLCRPGSSPNGYKIISLSKAHVKKYHSVHRIVALTFIPNPKSKSQVNHINGVKTDNSVVNLEWSTSSENQLHAYANGFSKAKQGKDVNCAKLDDTQIITIKSLKGHLLAKDIADYFKISIGHTRGIISGRLHSRLNHQTCQLQR